MAHGQVNLPFVIGLCTPPRVRCCTSGSTCTTLHHRTLLQYNITNATQFVWYTVLYSTAQYEK